jgi:hypothetical protein
MNVPELQHVLEQVSQIQAYLKAHREAKAKESK